MWVGAIPKGRPIPDVGGGKFPYLNGMENELRDAKTKAAASGSICANFGLAIGACILLFVLNACLEHWNVVDFPLPVTVMDAALIPGSRTVSTPDGIWNVENKTDGDGVLCVNIAKSK